ncbi:MAG: hypoxanthine phosphoribosyltransferase [Peptococcaceae bacterium]|jgi:hypoxanthine phosphoribosyltransferase|nr:hypoxanthine phosphoribosyltransferase [Peptococcaceae bacterium]MDR2737142.1 hypoxanthine phosphoribosyltransferase [Gracilibacteraceae bacterium]
MALLEIESVLLTEEEIAARVRELGEQITQDYKHLAVEVGEAPNILAVGVLKGVVPFYADLCRSIKLPLAFDFISVSSYGQATSSSGTVRILKDLDVPLENYHVLMIEDIIDTGLTLAYLKEYILRRNPRSFKIAALLDKPDRREVPIAADYNGFVIPDAFVVGYGLDCKECCRNLPHIAVVREV